MPLRLRIIGLGIGLLALVIAGCGSSSSSSSSNTSTASTAKSAVAVDLGTTKAGKVLVGPNGRAVYLFEKDKGTTSECSGACAKAWPPLTTSAKPTAGTGVTASMLGITKRADGTEQVTYNGHPLYYFEGDKKSGTIAGQGLDAFGAEWYVVGATGSKVETGEAKSGSKDSSSSSSDSGGSSSGGSSRGGSSGGSSSGGSSY
jgi:predicted lipoprotein with Yx(FWY)xxD motif